MSSLPLPTPKPNKDEDAEYNNLCKEYNHLMQTLPKGKGWWIHNIYNYNGFWLNPKIIKSNMILRTYFETRPTDLFLASFVKTGTTWLKALMFSTINRDRYTFTDHPLHHQGPHSTFTYINVESYPISDFSHLPEPRLFATHVARTLLPPCITSCKFVYVCRDPKDVLVSKWHFMNKIRSKVLPPLSFDEAFELFCQGVSDFGPFWEHAMSYWRASLESPDKILFLKYEELKKQPAVELRKLAVFMGKPFTAEEEEKGVVEEIVHLCSFKNLSNMDVNKKGVEEFGKNNVVVKKQDFFRKGEIGNWKNYLNDEMKQRIDRVTDEKFKGSGLTLSD